MTTTTATTTQLDTRPLDTRPGVPSGKNARQAGAPNPQQSKENPMVGQDKEGLR
jgi:hypothetical protein